ncbi:MAG: CBS domain-containing protein [Flavobacteriales bacterium]|nr:CBS domain-containing protein [Flavobacteriales bacterium]
MQATDLISPELVPLKPQDDIGRALDRMEELHVAHLPVVENLRLVGLVKDQDLSDRNAPLEPVSSCMERVEVPFVRSTQHIYEVVRLMVERNLSAVPVIDELGRYRGAATEQIALRKLAEVTNIREVGSVITLEMNQVDYSLHEIARIVEGNDGRLLSAFTQSLPGSNRIEVTLKINREDLSSILRTFERYDYYVKTTYQGSRAEEDLRERFEGLMRYLQP